MHTFGFFFGCLLFCLYKKIALYSRRWFLMSLGDNPFQLLIRLLLSVGCYPVPDHRYCYINRQKNVLITSGLSYMSLASATQYYYLIYSRLKYQQILVNCHKKLFQTYKIYKNNTKHHYQFSVINRILTYLIYDHLWPNTCQANDNLIS